MLLTILRETGNVRSALVASTAVPAPDRSGAARRVSAASIVCRRPLGPLSKVEGPRQVGAPGQPTAGLGGLVAAADAVTVARAARAVVPRDVAVPRPRPGLRRALRREACRVRPTVPKGHVVAAGAAGPDKRVPPVAGGAVVRPLAVQLLPTGLVPLPEALTGTAKAVEALVLRLPSLLAVARHGEGPRPRAALAPARKPRDEVADGRDAQRLAVRRQGPAEGTQATNGRAVPPAVWGLGRVRLAVGRLPAPPQLPQPLPGARRNSLAAPLRATNAGQQLAARPMTSVGRPAAVRAAAAVPVGPKVRLAVAKALTLGWAGPCARPRLVRPTLPPYAPWLLLCIDRLQAKPARRRSKRPVAAEEEGSLLAFAAVLSAPKPRIAELEIPPSALLVRMAPVRARFPLHEATAAPLLPGPVSGPRPTALSPLLAKLAVVVAVEARLLRPAGPP